MNALWATWIAGWSLVLACGADEPAKRLESPAPAKIEMRAKEVSVPLH